MVGGETNRSARAHSTLARRLIASTRQISSRRSAPSSPRDASGCEGRSNDEWSPAHQQFVTARLTPGGGTFHFENLVMPPLTKTCQKMVLPHKGGTLCVKDAFAKKFLVPGEVPLAARSRRFFGNTLLKAGHLDAVERCVRHCARSRPRDRDWPPRFRTIQVSPKDLRALPLHPKACDKLAQRVPGRSPWST